jgi:hypothetical protein
MAPLKQRNVIKIEPHHRPLTPPNLTNSRAQTIREILKIPTSAPKQLSNLLEAIRKELADYKTFEAAVKDNPKPSIKRKLCLKAAASLRSARGDVSCAGDWFKDALVQKGAAWTESRIKHLSDEMADLSSCMNDAATFFSKKTKPNTTGPIRALIHHAAFHLFDRDGKWPSRRELNKLTSELFLALEKRAYGRGLDDICKNVLLDLKRLG